MRNIFIHLSIALILIANSLEACFALETVKTVETIKLDDEAISELSDYQLGYRSNLLPVENKNESTNINIPRAKLKQKLGVLNTELIYQPWDKQYQFAGSLDLLELTNRKPSSSSANLNLEQGARDLVKGWYSQVKETSKEVYKTTKDQFSRCDENNICY